MNHLVTLCTLGFICKDNSLYQGSHWDFPGHPVDMGVTTSTPTPQLPRGAASSSDFFGFSVVVQLNGRRQRPLMGPFYQHKRFRSSGKRFGIGSPLCCLVLPPTSYLRSLPDWPWSARAQHQKQSQLPHRQLCSSCQCVRSNLHRESPAILQVLLDLFSSLSLHCLPTHHGEWD